MNVERIFIQLQIANGESGPKAYRMVYVHKRWHETRPIWQNFAAETDGIALQVVDQWLENCKRIDCHVIPVKLIHRSGLFGWKKRLVCRW